MDVVVKRGEFWLVNLDPAVGHEIKKARPCFILSPDEANQFLDTVVAAPLTSTIRNYPSRVPCVLKRRHGQIALDQIRCFDKTRLIKKMGKGKEELTKKVFGILEEYFRY